MDYAYILEAVRTPIGRKKGTLSRKPVPDLAAVVLKEIVKRTGINPLEIDDVVTGCAQQVGEQAFNLGRQAVLCAGLPIEVPATTIDRQCGSSQGALHFAAAEIMIGATELSIALGAESMNRVPMGSSFATAGHPFIESYTSRFGKFVPQGLGAEMIAEKWSLNRNELDAYSVISHQRVARAQVEGRFSKELVPVNVLAEDGQRIIFDKDECVRPTTTIEALAALKPSFKEDGKITAGNSSQISDGAAAVLLGSKEKARALGLRPRARILKQLVVGVDPVTMLTGPIPATKKILGKAGMTLKDMDLIEINEAFASVVLAWEKEYNPDMDKVNVNGGAIAIGHPLGATGCRLITTLLNELERQDKTLGLVTMCCGGGLGTATIIERV
ncbi:MAG: thiolase family protein [Candidatus Tectomicrobia bacterium]|uniref:Thiolase family protein n=1 Tax=Tectimicrobiota bacterium TaxID=2528274 RepID=A0A933GMP3_UNCTE|nr:thiolase family protein [Candidatus Tectomicrobia bacterium]